MVREDGSSDKQFFEIVNWKSAQPRMKGGGNDWMKLYTSLLDHDGFAGLSDTDKMTIVALWLYAARSGLYVMPADPKWLLRKIPLLGKEPDLGPLLEAKDVYGYPTPFIRYCRPPKAKTARKKIGSENRLEESREEKREETKPSRVSGEKKREKKRRVGTKSGKEQKKEQKAAAEPENPNESDAGSADLRHIVPRPTRSAFNNRDPQRIGNIIAGRFPQHWQDSDAEAFGWEIVEALGMPRDVENERIRSEWGAFASFWCKIKERASPMLLDELRRVAVEKARFVNSPRCKSARNKSAEWFHIMYSEMDHHGIQIPRQKSKSG